VSASATNRSTSHAKTVDLDHQKNALDRALALNEEFKRAKAAQDRALQQEKIVPLEKTGPSHAPRPEPHLRPEGEIRRAVDKEIDQEKLERENQRARELNEAIKRQAEQQKMQLNNQRHKGMEHSR
jgi:hypothetical protein